MIKRITLLVFVLLTFSLPSIAQWNSLDTDPSGDGNDPELLDGLEYEYMHDLESDSLFFRIKVTDISDPQSMNIGVNLMVWFPYPNANESLFSFWSPGNTVEWHRLLTVWITGTAPDNYSGVTGISSGSDVNNNNYNAIADDLTVRVSTTDNTIIIGMNRSDFIPDDQIGENVEIAGAVGSSMAWNDDLISIGVIPTIVLDAVLSSVDAIVQDNISVYPNPSNSQINIHSELDNGVSSIEIYDFNGRLIRNINSEVQSNIDISALPTGTYILKAYSKGTLIGSSKLIKLPN